MAQKSVGRPIATGNDELTHRQDVGMSAHGRSGQSQSFHTTVVSINDSLTRVQAKRS
ncbi:MAG: hypothetical protein ACR2ND_11765 [Solirubrobacteraceae bacterium]